MVGGDMNPKRRKLVTATRRNNVKSQSNFEQVFQDKKRKQQSNTIKQFPDDIVVEILSRLSVKSLCRFKCICKSWCNLMSDSLFVKLQLNQSIQANRLTYVLYGRFDFPRRLELDYESLVSGHEAKPTADDSLFGPKIRGQDKNIHLTRKMEVWGSCNGLLCIFAAPRILVLANPSTRETKTIFCSYGPKSRRHTIDSSSLGGGFGYDAFHDDYKVVKINSHIRTVDVYSLKNCSWSYRGNLPHDVVSIRGHKSRHLNGAIHWIACHELVNGSKPEPACITAFDLTKEEFFSILTPVSGYDLVWCQLYTMGGCLCIVHVRNFEQIRDVWVMEIYGVKDSWKRISLTFGNSLTPLNLPLNFPMSEEALFLADGRLFLYNHKNGSRKKLSIGQIPAGYVSYNKMDAAFSYVESLVSLGCSTRMSKHSRKLESRRKQKA